MDVSLGTPPITLDSRYAELDSPVLLTGIQALVRVLLEQARLDRAAGLNTGGLVSGYRGSPLGGLDQELWRREKLLTAHGIKFQPGLNEDLAVTMLSGSQQLDFYAGAAVDGVFGMWYGKGPGVDRSADAFRVANAFGSHRHGGVLAIAGDDHGAHSSTFPHQTDQIFEAVMMPVLQPADVAEIIEFGLAGMAMSRFSGLWVAMKTIAETAEQSATVTVPAARSFVTPDIALPPHGLNIDPHLKWPAERFADRAPHAGGAPARRRGLVARQRHRPRDPGRRGGAGRHRHRRQGAPRRAARAGGAGPGRLAGIAIYKVGMTWPLETEGLRAFAAGRRRCWWWRRSAPSWRRRSAPRYTTCPPTGVPPCWARPRWTARRCCPPIMELSPELLAPRWPGCCPASASRRRAGAARRAGAPRRRPAGPRADLLRRLPAQHLHPPAGRQPAPWRASAAT